MMTSQCKHCIHIRLNTPSITCDAFPNGIPKDILTGNFDHNNEYDGDNGIRFEEA